MDKILYGAAYYDEYMPEERLEKDMQMMQRAGINVIRIAESTWACEEPEEGVFDFYHVQRTIEAAARYGISVIVGTPTYAIPPWLAAKHPDIIAVTSDGPGKYGVRQNMDITNPHYRFYAERIIRRLMEASAAYDNVIGFQLDNETKHYGVAGEGVQRMFRTYLQEKFGTVEEMNRAFGFNYWSNRVDCWENLPDVTGTINGSFLAEFEKFRRSLVTDFLCWQRKIVDEYRREDQFVTHNFDFAWREFSFGVQPDVDHFTAAKAVTIAGCDIYHHTQDELTGREAAFCGAIARSLHGSNYLVLETQAQGQIDWLPYDGQLRLQAFSHLANGADSVLYWHWHSIHHSFETYWRGILSHDMEENRVYREAAAIGTDLQRIGDHLVHLRKTNRAAILVSNESLTALTKRPLFPLPDASVQYNDIVRQYADALYALNIEYDVVSTYARDFSAYDLLIVPALYSAPDELLLALKQYVHDGGTMLMTYKSAYANEMLGTSCDRKPHLLTECLGVSYQEYTEPKHTALRLTEEMDCTMSEDARHISTWMELLLPKEDTQVLAYYEHPFWGDYAAVTAHTFGEGSGLYVGCHVTEEMAKALVRLAADRAGLDTTLADAFPVVMRSGVNQYGHAVHYYMNFSRNTVTLSYRHSDAKELLRGEKVSSSDTLHLQPWETAIFEEIRETENKS